MAKIYAEGFELGSLSDGKSRAFKFPADGELGVMTIDSSGQGVRYVTRDRWPEWAMRLLRPLLYKRMEVPFLAESADPERKATEG